MESRHADREAPEAGKGRFPWLDVALVPVLLVLATALLLAEPSPSREWSPSQGNALLGLNSIAWGIAFALAYRFPRASAVLRLLASLAAVVDRMGPFKLRHLSTLVLAVFFLFVGALMFITGAGWA